MIPMKILGIETSCDECAAAVVENGKIVLSNVINSQIPFHAAFNGVVPEIASRKHIEWIKVVVNEALDRAGLEPGAVDAVAVSNRPGLLGSLLVGLSFAKAFAWALNKPFIAVDHMLAHLYASRLDAAGSTPALDTAKAAGSAAQVPAPQCPLPPCPAPPAYPFLGLLVSGGHSIICRADNFDDISVLGATIDDAVGEAFDKVSKHYGFGYPGGAVIDALAKTGNPKAYNFPLPNLHKSKNRCDFSYSGLKTAVIHQLDQFKALKANEPSPADIAASFQKTAVEILLRGLYNAVELTGIKTIVAGGGVAANSLLRQRLAERKDLNCVFPPPELCGDNGAMIAGIGYQYLARGETSPLSVTASARVQGFKRKLRE